MGKYKVLKVRGITFVFKFDEDDPEILHIFARHLTSIDDALDVFFGTTPTWNLNRQRYENLSETHGLYWFWLDEPKKKVMIISCFRRL